MDMGLHLRPSAALVKTAHRFSADMAISNGKTTVNGKNFLSVIILSAEQGSRLRIMTEGADAIQLMDAIGKLFACNFGEPRGAMDPGPQMTEQMAA